MTEREKDPAAVKLGRKGGKAKSDAKTAAARANGRKGAAVRWKDHVPSSKPSTSQKTRRSVRQQKEK